MPERNGWNKKNLNVASDQNFNRNNVTKTESQTIIGEQRSLSGKRTQVKLKQTINKNANILSDLAITDNATSD